MEPAAEAAVRARHDILATDQLGKPQDSFCDQLWMFDDVGGVTDNPRDEYLALRKFYLLPDAPLVFVARIGCLNQVGAGAYLEQQADNILERQIRRMRPVPSAPADMVAHTVLRNIRQRTHRRSQFSLEQGPIDFAPK